MDRLVLTKDSATNLTIDKNSYVVISDDVGSYIFEKGI